MNNLGAFNKTPPGFRQEGRMADAKTYIGIVKDNQDAQKMGRLRVFIPEIGGDPENDTHWVVVSYASPFAGVTSFKDVDGNSKSMSGSQQSYGFWMMPPDLETQVLITFVNGDFNRGFWFACIWEQNMNHMVPGVAVNASYEANDSGRYLAPVVEYNKKSKDLNVDDPIRPRFDPLAAGLMQQGLQGDQQRGTSTASARRESPSRVYGLLTPRANQLYVDDNPNNEYIRLRTRSGTQVLIHETNGYVYINSGKGNSWIEISDDGIDVYSAGNISMHTEQDMNIRADKNINLDAGQNIHMTAAQNTYQSSGQNHSILTGANYSRTVKGNTSSVTQGNDHNRVTGSFNVNSGDVMTLKTNATFTVNSGGDLVQVSGGAQYRNGTQLNDNTKAAPVAPNAVAQAVEAAPTISYNNGQHGSTNSTVSRLPTHEPWSGHPKTSNTIPPRGYEAGKTATTDGKPNGPQSTSVQNTNTEQAQPKQATGEGNNKPVSGTDDLGPPVDVKGRKVSSEVLAAIKKAASLTGIDIGFLMCMADIESSLGTNLKASTSSARGLYQFVSGTWTDMVNRYGRNSKSKKYDIGIQDIDDLESNAIMAAQMALDNKTILEKALKRDITPTDLYITHLLGCGGGPRFLKAPSDGLATQAANPDQVRANANIFYSDKSYSQSRTVQEVYNLFAKKMAAAPSWTTALANTPGTTTA